MKTYCIFAIILCLPAFQLWAQDNTYPTEERLFHIERSKNRNLVCYDLRLKEGGPDKKKPLEVYWINREEKPGERKGLTFIQDKFAYGYKSDSDGTNVWTITLKAYPDRKLTLSALNGKYVCTLSIDNRNAILQKLYVKAKEEDSLSVEYVELFGVAVDDGTLVTEKVYTQN